jgi:hypothetical protein
MLINCYLQLMQKLKSPQNTDILIDMCNKYSALIESFNQSELVKASQGKKLDELQIAVNHYIIRTLLNVKALEQLLQLYKTQRGIIYPIGLILRATFSDFITFCYLLTFCENGNIVTESFKNETILFDRDGLKSFVEMMELEADLETYLPNTPPNFIGKSETHKKIEHVKSITYKQFFDNKGNWKKASALRNSSDKSLFTKYQTPFDEPNGFVSEKYKWDRIRKSDSFKKYILAFFGYKVFSQFQHYSSLSMELLSKEQENYLYYYLITAVDSIFIISDLYIQLLDDNFNPQLVELRKIKNEIDSITTQ